MKVIGFIAVLITGALLLYAAGDLPDFGDVNSAPSQAGTSKYYIEQTYNGLYALTEKIKRGGTER